MLRCRRIVHLFEATYGQADDDDDNANGGGSVASSAVDGQRATAGAVAAAGGDTTPYLDMMGSSTATADDSRANGSISEYVDVTAPDYVSGGSRSSSRVGSLTYSASPYARYDGPASASASVSASASSSMTLRSVDSSSLYDQCSFQVSHIRKCCGNFM